MLPSTIQLLIPNFNIWTFIGAFIIISMVLMSIYFHSLLPARFGILGVLIGITLIWGVSIIQDFWNTKEGVIIITSLVILLISGGVIFYEPKGVKK